jgi:hypothetical protein
MMQYIPRISIATGLAFLSANSVVDSSGVGSLLKSTRRLEDNAYFEYDLSEFSLRFEKCQYVKTFDDDLAQDEDSESPLALKHFVVYRLCPSDSCSDSDACDEGAYGRYVTDVQSYLKYTIENRQEYLENFCDTCDEQCNNDEDGDGEADYNAYYDCSCSEVCNKYENLADYGYVDASEYMECQAFQQNGDDDDNTMYIGPRCSTSGKQITIGMFSDENCFEPIEDVDVEQLLGTKLSYHLLTHSYDNENRVCLSCKEDNDN